MSQSFVTKKITNRLFQEVGIKRRKESGKKEYKMYWKQSKIQINDEINIKKKRMQIECEEGGTDRKS